jgi:hypothetical protein
VRDCSRCTFLVRTRSPEEHYRYFRGADGSRIAERKFRDCREISFALHRVLPGRCSYDRLHQARSRDELQDNRNLKHNNRSDAADGTCGLRTSDFEGDATRSFHNASDSYVGSARESQSGRLSGKFRQRNNFHWHPLTLSSPQIGERKEISIPKRATSVFGGKMLKRTSFPFLKGRGLR